MTWTSTILPWIDGSGSICCVQEFAPLHGEQEVKVCLVNVNDAKAVDLVIACVFEDHRIDDEFPSFEYVPRLNTEIDESENQFGNGRLFGFEDFECSLAIFVRFWDI